MGALSVPAIARAGVSGSRTVVSRSPAQTRALGARLGQHSQPGDLLLLVGDLGTGKTCLVQGLALGLGVPEAVVSPSFVLLRQYRGRLPLCHVDLYRIQEPEEIESLGLETYLAGDGVTVVEWADRALEAFPPQHLLMRLSYLSPRKRRLVLEPRGDRYEALLAEVGRAWS